MPNEPVRHHYIPQFILRNFSARGDGFVRYYDLKKKEISNKPTEEIFVYNNLYRDERAHPDEPTKIESDLSRYEGEIAMLLKKKFYKGDEFTISFNEEEKLKLFLAIMAFRNRHTNTAFGKDADPRLLKFYEPYLKDGNMNDLWKKNLGLLVNCRSIKEVLNHKEMDEPFKHLVFMTGFGLTGTHLIVAERRGKEDFVVGDHFPSIQMHLFQL